jgi:DNA helicase HerA-like ATPase
VIVMIEIEKELDNSERIGVIGSPSSTAELTLDILGTAASKKLIGNLSIFRYIQDGRDNYALGQITEIVMQNVWTQDPTMRGIIRQRGRVDPITEKQDVHTAKMMVSAVFRRGSKTLEPSILGTVPPTGTSINLVSKGIMNELLKGYTQELFYLGKVYGTDILLPMWFKHFGSGHLGAGEAYHIGVFGKTGSGKSVLAIMMMIGYLKHKNMSIFVLDPQGQFSREFRRPETKDLVEQKLKREIRIINLHNLVLSGYPLFKKILVSSNYLISWCNIKHPDNQRLAADQIANILEGKILGGKNLNEITPWEAYSRDAFDRVWDTILDNDLIQRRIYTSDESRQTMILTMESADRDQIYEEWKRIANLFAYKAKKDGIIIKDLVKKIIHENGAKKTALIIDLSEFNIPENIFWNEQIKCIVISEFLSQLVRQAEEQYKKEKLLNTLVIIDEAHRLAPREKIENEDLERVRSTLVDGIRTTRKYGLGWMFISQTLSSLDRDIINQIRVYVFGFGLALGVERQALRELIGGAGEALTLYQTFKDPQSSLGEKEFPFMTFGPISPLSFSSMPLFFDASKYPEEFIRINFGGEQ